VEKGGDVTHMIWTPHVRPNGPREAHDRALAGLKAALRVAREARDQGATAAPSISRYPGGFGVKGSLE
jgi:hypothetical protein